MNLYLNEGDTLNAVKVANEIINKPVKVQSVRVDVIVKEAFVLLKGE